MPCPCDATPSPLHHPIHPKQYRSACCHHHPIPSWSAPSYLTHIPSLPAPPCNRPAYVAPHRYELTLTFAKSAVCAGEDSSCMSMYYAIPSRPTPSDPPCPSPPAASQYALPPHTTPPRPVHSPTSSSLNPSHHTHTTPTPPQPTSPHLMAFSSHRHTRHTNAGARPVMAAVELPVAAAAAAAAADQWQQQSA